MQKPIQRLNYGPRLIFILRCILQLTIIAKTYKTLKNHVFCTRFSTKKFIHTRIAIFHTDGIFSLHIKPLRGKTVRELRLI